MQLLRIDDGSGDGTLVVRGSTHALLFLISSAPAAQAIVKLLSAESSQIASARRIQSSIYGILGLVGIVGDIFLAVVTNASNVGNTRPISSSPENVSRIYRVEFYSLTNSAWDDAPLIPQDDPTIFSDTTSTASQPTVYANPCAALSKILSTGTFYYTPSPQWDLSTRLPERLKRPSEGKDIASYEPAFTWNAYILQPLLDFRSSLEDSERAIIDREQFLLSVIQGFVGVEKLPFGTLAIISRLSSRRAGTRFNTRGVDDDGHTANFVETELLFSSETACFSYAQIRGSVPLFWEQQGLQTFQQRIQLTRPHASQPAFDRHFAHLHDTYGDIHVVNLLGQKENESALTSAYAAALRATPSVPGATHYDFHSAVRQGGHEAVVRELGHLAGVHSGLETFGCTSADQNGALVEQQAGVFRTNCLDCLDRTNFVQDVLARTALEEHLVNTHRELLASVSLWAAHRELWAENGDALSRIYAGTGALNTSYTRSGKRTLGGLLADATKSVSRAYINNFQDKGKQVAIDTLLGNLSDSKSVAIFDPIHDAMRAKLAERIDEYSTRTQSTIFVGTWNLNGRPPSESLLPWLFPRDNAEPDMFVLGFQEIVPLTAQQIVQTDPEKKALWENTIMETLLKRPKKKADYVILRSEQLVGTALVVLVKTELAGVIRNVEAATRKTGLRGMAGNKGAIAIRLQYHNTSYCFLTAHLAAGHMNIEERNADYWTIANGLQFLRGKTIPSHDVVIWAADTNYRITLDNQTTRQLATSDDFDALVAADQLRYAMDARTAFVGYEEGPLLFRPTYRYDLNSDEYDTSEKMRIPAWTDRILYRGANLDLSVYSRADLRGSDHRPVFAIFRTQVRVIDEAKRASLSRSLLEAITASSSRGELPIPARHNGGQTPSPLHPGSGSNQSYPPPSSEEQSWWQVPGDPSGVVSPLNFTELVGVARRPQNPFESPFGSLVSSSSDEELYTDAMRIQTPKPPPPPPRSSKPKLISG